MLVGYCGKMEWRAQKAKCLLFVTLFGISLCAGPVQAKPYQEPANKGPARTIPRPPKEGPANDRPIVMSRPPTEGSGGSAVGPLPPNDGPGGIPVMDPGPSKEGSVGIVPGQPNEGTTIADPPPVAQQQTQPAAQPQTEPAAQPQTEPVAQPQTEPVAQPQTEPAAQPQTEPVAQPQTEPATEQEIQPLKQPKPQVTRPQVQKTTKKSMPQKQPPATEQEIQPAIPPQQEPANRPPRTFSSLDAKLEYYQNEFETMLDKALAAGKTAAQLEKMELQFDKRIRQMEVAGKQAAKAALSSVAKPVTDPDLRAELTEARMITSIFQPNSVSPAASAGNNRVLQNSRPISMANPQTNGNNMVPSAIDRLNGQMNNNLRQSSGAMYRGPRTAVGKQQRTFSPVGSSIAAANLVLDPDIKNEIRKAQALLRRYNIPSGGSISNNNYNSFGNRPTRTGSRVRNPTRRLNRNTARRNPTSNTYVDPEVLREMNEMQSLFSNRLQQRRSNSRGHIYNNQRDRITQSTATGRRNSYSNPNTSWYGFMNGFGTDLGLYNNGMANSALYNSGLNQYRGSNNVGWQSFTSSYSPRMSFWDQMAAFEALSEFSEMPMNQLFNYSPAFSRRRQGYYFF